MPEQAMGQLGMIAKTLDIPLSTVLTPQTQSRRTPAGPCDLVAEAGKIAAVLPQPAQQRLIEIMRAFAELEGARQQAS